MAALTFIQGASGGTSTGNPSLAYGTNTTGGSFLLAWIGASGVGVTLGAPTDTLLNTWVKIGATQTYGSGSAVFYYVPSNKVGGGANTVQFSATTASLTAYGIAELTGQATSSPLDQTSFIASFSSTNSSATFTSINPTVANEEIIAIFLSNAAQSLTAGANFASTALSGNFAQIEYGAFASSGTQSVTGTFTVSGRTMVGLALSVKSTSSPSSGGGNSSWLTVNMNNSLRGLRH